MMRRTMKTTGLLTILTLVILVNTAQAIDDGGGRSIFARGAGERALAIGGAYGAVADGPAAMIWNPAGLGRLDRKNVYASNSTLIGMGFNEQLGLFALPSWKIGTFGFGFRRFGVDGIEGRDDRGSLFDDNLKDTETEILLGYGRNLGGAWDIGLVFKYQQQNLAGYNDGAPGLDLGVMVKPLKAAGNQSEWAEAFSAGLAIRNLIEPNLRLIDEGVKDPTGLRFGLALDKDLSTNFHLLVSADVEKTRDMDTHLHGGAELQLMDLLALRLGTNAGMLTAGAGIDYRSFAFDYAFEDNILETVHRFGLGYAFGRTTEESRQLSLATQEAELQKQLANAFQKENDHRIKAMMAQARGAVDDGDFEHALRGTETVRVLDPGYPGLENLEAAAYFGQGRHLEKQGDLSRSALAYQRCLAIDPDHPQATARLKSVLDRSDQLAARSENLRKLFDTALEAYAQGDLVKARAGFARILELSPADREAEVFLQNTTQTLELRAGSLTEQAQAQALAGNLVAARASLEKARLLAPYHPALDQTAAMIAEQERRNAATTRESQAAAANAGDDQEAMDMVAPAPVKPTFAALPENERREVADLYQRGLRALEQGRHEDAISYWELVWSRAPDYQQVAQNLKQEYLVQGMEAFAAGQLDKSIVVWEKAQTVDPDDPRTRGYLARAYEHQSRIREIRGVQ